jgi:hypothetical protein
VAEDNVAPPSVPAAQPEPTEKPHKARHGHHSTTTEAEETKKHKAKNHVSKKSLGAHHGSDGSDSSDDDDDSWRTCGNGRREEGEACDSSLDDTWWTVCNSRCEAEVFWPSILVLIFLIVLLFVCCGYFGVSHVHAHYVAPVAVRKVVICRLHQRQNCPICSGKEKTKPTVEVVVQKAKGAEASMSSSSSSSESGSGKRKNKKATQ